MIRARILLLLALAANPLDCQAIEAQRTLESYAFLQSLFPRPEGSAAEGAVLESIESHLAQLGIPASRFDFHESDLNHSFSSCLAATIAGERRDTLILAVPLNHPPEANRDRDGSINIALALGFLEELAREKPPISVTALFLGAEFGEGADYPMGAQLFLRDFTPDYRVAVLYLNLRSIPSRLHVRAGGRGIEAPYWLIDRATRALKAAGLFFLLRGNENQIFRAGLTEERTIIEPFLASGYPAVSLEGIYDGLPEAGELAWTAAFGRFLETFLEAFRSGVPETWDLHYLFFQARGFNLRISEQLYVVLLIAAISGVLIYSLIFTRRLRRYLRLLGRDLWVLPLYLGFIFLLLFLASWALEGIQRLRNLTELWADLPLPFLAFKLVVPLLIFFALLRLLRLVHVPLRGSFYSAAALLFLLLDIVVLAVVNLAFTYYFLWAFVFALLFTAVSNRVLKLLFFLASPYWIVKTVVELFTLPILPFCRVVLLSKIWGNVLLAVALLPFVLMFIRLRMLLPLFRITSRRTRQIVSACAFAAVSAGLTAFFLAYSPYGPARPQPVTARYLIDREKGESSLRLASPAPLSKIVLDKSGERVPIDTRAAYYRLELPDTGELLKTEISSWGFLDRKNVNLSLEPLGAPVHILLTLSSPEDFVLYDANFPYQREPDGRRYTMLIGANPPLPLSVQLTLPQSRRFRLDITLEYVDPPLDFKLSGENKAIRSRLTYRSALELQT